jgi:hypothetical protein
MTQSAGKGDDSVRIEAPLALGHHAVVEIFGD